MITIVAPDTHTASFDAISWSAVEELGTFIPYASTTPAQRVERLVEAEAILSNKVVLDAALIEELPKLQYIGITATGINNVDLKAAQSKGIAVTNVPGYSTHSVSQLCMSFILDYFSKVTENCSKEAIEIWKNDTHFSYVHRPFTEIQGKTLGILGAGAIGKQLARIAEAFGMHVLYAKLPGRDYTGDSHSPLEEVLQLSDVISIHCPLTEHTQNLMDHTKLSLMKADAMLINTARGGIVHEDDLFQALKDGIIAHAYCDVLSTEPPPDSLLLLSARNLTISPHIAWASRESRVRLIAETAKNLASFLNGGTRNRVDLNQKS